MGIPILWRNTKARYSLQGEKCPDCTRVVFPPRRLCPYCGCEADQHEAEAAPVAYSFVLPTNVEFRAMGDD